MCMFCAALPMVAGATAVAQGEQRKKSQARVAQKQPASATLVSDDKEQRVAHAPGQTWLTPKRITQLGALTFVLLLGGSGFYHTHFPG